MTQRRAKNGLGFKWPTIDVTPSGTVMVDIPQVRKLARSCSVYAVGKMLAKQGVPIREAARVLKQLDRQWPMLMDRWSVTFGYQQWDQNNINREQSAR